MARGVRGARITAMPKMADVSKGMERGPIKKAILPALESDEREYV
jgi:hypothetical protein